jgi:two-component system, chemotaxis family, protein-glutamate methylesterase/glutaminase
VGGSAGALHVLQHIVRDLPQDFPAPLFVVLHLSPDVPSALADILNREANLPASFARNGEKIAPSRIYIAPPDRHLLVADGALQLTRGPRENRSRPAIDPLFRSAAQSYGSRVIAVLLSGLLDDGVQGLQVVSGRRGTVIVLKPEDATFPEMPENAIKYDHPDYVLAAAEIPRTLQELVGNSANGPGVKAQKQLEQGKTVPSGFVCPDCGGELFEEGTHNLPYFRCRVGHSYSIDTLLSAQNETVEDALWAAVRSLKENAELKVRTATTLERGGSTSNAARLREDARSQLEQARLLQERILDASERL